MASSVFDVGGNRYRIATVIHYDKKRLYVRQVMTHAEYDRNHPLYSLVSVVGDLIEAYEIDHDPADAAGNS